MADCADSNHSESNFYNSKFIHVLAACTFALPVSSVFALGIIESYQSAIDNDPIFMSARSDKAAGDEYRNLGLSNLLPNLGLSYNYGLNDVKRTPIIPRDLHYDSTVLALSVRQPLYNPEGWQRYRGGQAQANYSEAKFASSKQELIIRVLTAYLETLLAEDKLRLAVAQRDAYRENQLANERMFEKGAGTRTDMLETQARYELARAMVVEAEDDVINRRSELAVIIGREPGTLDALLPDLPEFNLPIGVLPNWERLARNQNPEVIASRYNVEFAKTEEERNRAGHYPRADLVASRSINNSESLITLNQQSTINSIGLQMSIPLYSGGSVNAQIRQAIAKLASARADLESTTQKTLIEVRKQFQLVASSHIRIDAMTMAEHSAAETVTATRKSVTGGQRINLDVLTALQQLYTIRRDLSDSRHRYLLAWLRLNAAAGVLNSDELVRIAAFFRRAP